MTGKDGRRPGRRERPDEAQDEAIDRFLGSEALEWLEHPNVVGVLLGRKSVGGGETGQEAIVFQVERKLSERGDILAIGSKPIPAEIEIGGRRYPTDVLEGVYRPDDGEGGDVDPRRRFPFICPGVSIGNAGVAGDAGTGTAVVRHRASGRLALLSCDHVLRRQGGNGKATQPGPADGARPQDVFGPIIGVAIRNLDGDAAIAAIENRPAELRIPGLGVAIQQVGVARPGDLVVKAGRSTGISYGVVAGPAVMRIPYSDSAPTKVRGIKITPVDGISPEKGDSGAPWLLADPATRRPTGILVGIHTARTTQGAFACLPSSVFEKLGIEPAGPADMAAATLPFTALTAGVPGSAAFRVNARRGLLLRGGAGREFDAIDSLPLGTIVTRLAMRGEWAQVDLAGDGAADGFVYAPFLEPLDPADGPAGGR